MTLIASLPADIPAPPFAWNIANVSVDGAKYVHAIDRQRTVIISVSVELDGRRWRHLSTARPDRLPSYRELVEIKEKFLGPETKAIQVFAPRSEHVNIHPFCLHLWECLDGDVLPDFTRGTGQL